MGTILKSKRNRKGIKKKPELMKMPLGSCKPYSKSKRHKILQPVHFKSIPAKLSDCPNQNVWAVKAGEKRTLRLYTSIYRVTLGSATLFRPTSYFVTYAVVRCVAMIFSGILCTINIKLFAPFKAKSIVLMRLLYVYVFITQTVNAFIILQTICIVTWL